MTPTGDQEHLSRISTLWTLVHKAHAAADQDVQSAQQQLLERYGGAVHRYLLGALRNADAADDLFQEFCLRVLRGTFRNAQKERGRFRDFLKTSIFHLVVDYQKAQGKMRPMLDQVAEPAVEAPSIAESEQQFLDSWRAELMARTWLALEQLERQTGQPYHTVLRLRTDQPLLSSQELAEQLGPRLGKKFSVDSARQTLHRAREKFSDLLLEEVVQSLETADRQRLEEELAEIGMLSYCQASLQRRYGA